MGFEWLMVLEVSRGKEMEEIKFNSWHYLWQGESA
jgi:hypothetical protein